MLTKLPQFWQNRQIRVKTLSIIAACCFAMGLAIPSGLHWIKPSVAETLPAPPPVALTSQSVHPGIVRGNCRKTESIGGQYQSRQKNCQHRLFAT